MVLTILSILFALLLIGIFIVYNTDVDEDPIFVLGITLVSICPIAIIAYSIEGDYKSRIEPISVKINNIEDRIIIIEDGDRTFLVKNFQKIEDILNCKTFYKKYEENIYAYESCENDIFYKKNDKLIKINNYVKSK